MRLTPLILALSLGGAAVAAPTQLIQSVDLPITIEGKTVGSMKLPAGSEVEIVSNDGTNAVIKRGGTTYTIAAESLPATSATATTSAASTQPTPTAKAPQAVASRTPFASKTLDKTLNESTMTPFFVPVGEHSPSIIDASRLNDEMPGKNGWLTVRGGHLYNGEKRLRIAGVNVTPLPVSDNDIAEMKKYGFNGVRIHATGTFYKKNRAMTGLPLQKFFNGSQIDPEGLHLLDEQVAKFINAGFWIDMNIITKPQPGQADDSLRELDKKYLAALFKHVNPYTGHSYANEPAIFAVEVANEFGVREHLNNPDSRWADMFDPSPYNKAIESKWNKWVNNHYKTQAELDAAWPSNTQKLGNIQWNGDDSTRQFSEQQHKDWSLFTYELENDYSKDLVAYIHNDLHYPGLVMTGCLGIKLQTRNIGDAAFEHHYNMNGMPIAKDRTFQNAAMSRIVGKPYFVNEFNVKMLNKYKAETALSALATATAQDWDGLFFFSWVHTNLGFVRNDKGERVEFNTNMKEGPENMIRGTWAVRDNPALMVSLPTAINLFRRGDIAPVCEKAYSNTLETTGWKEEFKKPYGVFKYQLGISLAGNTDAGAPFGEQGVYNFDGKTLNITSPKTVLSIGTSTNNQLGGIHYELGKTQLGWSCVSVTSLNNDLPIKDANQLLVTLLGNTGNTGAAPLPNLKDFSSEEGFKKAYIQAVGTAPAITECISANVFIPVDTSKGTFKACALDEKAQHKAEIPLEVTADGITLHTTGKEGTVWYEIARK